MAGDETQDRVKTSSDTLAPFPLEYLPKKATRQTGKFELACMIAGSLLLGTFVTWTIFVTIPAYRAVTDAVSYDRYGWCKAIGGTVFFAMLGVDLLGVLVGVRSGFKYGWSPQAILATAGCAATPFTLMFLRGM